MEVVREDTGEVVDSRALTQEELQGKLFDGVDLTLVEGRGR